ncbi:DNA repair protein XRCC3-like [Copidosoma floridanum]|uniref:DNA repair protein XRCC3-like n=1 Tax=Copidosoma floridanum TaxID=29053 RepID=UPI0006C9AFA9|nr:DNA repair protein XRCC3-like [Copidosoma floridanum]
MTYQIWRQDIGYENDSGNVISTGCSKLDCFLGGGLPVKGITQIYGESGVGKTQLALQLCLKNVQEKKSGVAYISTDAIFPSKRLQELRRKIFIRNHSNVNYDRIFIEHISSKKDFEDCIFSSKRLQYLLSKYNIQLLIIDSIAGTYRFEYETRNIIDRAKSLRKMGYQLQKLASLHSLAVVCINQVTAVPQNLCGKQSFARVQPSLGITWASIVTNSFYMYKQNSHRYFYVAGSPYLPNKTIEYKILDSGVVMLTS